jgi:hypothetical protein
MALNRNSEAGIDNETIAKNRKRIKVWRVEWKETSRVAGRWQREEDFWTEGEAFTRYNELSADHHRSNVAYSKRLIDAEDWDRLTPDERRVWLAHVAKSKEEEAESRRALEERCNELRKEIRIAVLAVDKPEATLLIERTYGELQTETAIETDWPLIVTVEYPSRRPWKDTIDPAHIRVNSISYTHTAETMAKAIEAFEYARQLAIAINGVTDDWPEGWH